MTKTVEKPQKKQKVIPRRKSTRITKNEIRSIMTVDVLMLAVNEIVKHVRGRYPTEGEMADLMDGVIMAASKAKNKALFGRQTPAVKKVINRGKNRKS
jgi:cell division protein FtsL